MSPQLFDFAAHCLSAFLDAHSVKNQALKLGFNFSFPCHQTGLDKVRWGTHRGCWVERDRSSCEGHKGKKQPRFSAPRALSFPGQKALGAVVWKARMWSSC